MPPLPPAPVPSRSAADWNDAIRVLARTAWGRPFTDAERKEYHLLLVGWAAADRAETAA
ncbi:MULTISPECIES: hypothetical protein [Streptomyces]|uniref:Uncharacterized protein n=1 Tax=Streptomyces doudnae TaxID=3075536 RepID=A0ABD5EY25_9ACTN|nr:hypothetical protein [Streptomyces sp. DSM 41981]MDT0439637.1 hypothetical protein [Streptomyces sp. DSM 41981]